MDKDKISIVIPLYNAEKYIKKCIESILNQSYKNIELIVVNDGSTDKSAEVCSKIKDKRLIFINQSNFGAPAARNNGLSVATGKYIMFFDSDDVLDTNALEKLYLAMIRDKSDLSYGRTMQIDENDNLLNEKIITPKVSLCNKEKEYYSIDPYPGNKLYKMSIIKKNNITFGNVRIGQDLNFYLKYILFCKKISLCDDVVSYYRVVSNSISRTINFNIFDIVNSLNNVEKFYKVNNASQYDFLVLNSIKIYHYINQMKKLRNFRKIIDRKLVYLYFKKQLKGLYRNCDLTSKCKNEFKLKQLYLFLIHGIPIKK